MDTMKNKLTQEHLKECLTYDHETGSFTWNERPLSHFKDSRSRNSWNSRWANKNAGIVGNRGYIIINIKNFKAHLGHRLAFLYMEGYLPENQVDHINRIRNDNRWVNLREVSRQCNLQNASQYITNSSGVTGVHWVKRDKRWVAKITINQKTIRLGVYERFSDAVMARYNEELTNNMWACHTDSTAYNYLKENNLLGEFSKRDFKRNNLKSNNKTGVTGITFDKSKNRFISNITVNKKIIYIGAFKKFEDAVKARYQEEINNPFWSCSTESSAYKYLRDNNLI